MKLLCLLNYVILLLYVQVNRPQCAVIQVLVVYFSSSVGQNDWWCQSVKREEAGLVGQACNTQLLQAGHTGLIPIPSLGSNFFHAWLWLFWFLTLTFPEPNLNQVILMPKHNHVTLRWGKVREPHVQHPDAKGMLWYWYQTQIGVTKCQYLTTWEWECIGRTALMNDIAVFCCPPSLPLPHLLPIPPCFNRGGGKHETMRPTLPSEDPFSPTVAVTF